MNAADSARTAWQRFSETFEPLRPELYRYCRYLTHNAWDAEDLVQDALARGLVTLGCLFQEPSAVIDAFCDAFNAHDLDRLVSLLLDTATADVVGIATEYGPGKMKQSDTGSLYHSLCSPISHAVAEEFLDGYRGGLARVERKEHRGEPILVSWYDHNEGPAVRDVIRLTEEDGRVASIRFYFFCPEVIAEICGELALPFRSNGYRYWPKT